jgi:protein ImuB
MVVCVHLPRFELLIAAEGRPRGARRAPAEAGSGAARQMGAEQLMGRVLAVAPQAGAEQRVGEVSGGAEAYGVERGMALGEALARCPELELLAPDPPLVAREWERTLRGLEGMGAAVEPERVGLAYFQADGLRGLYGGVQDTIAVARRAIGRPAHFGAGPTCFCALAAALEVRSRRAVVVDEGSVQRYLSRRPVSLLGFRDQTEPLVAPLGRLGVHTLGELRELGRSALADRFGAAGVLAHRLACGEDRPLRVRSERELMEEAMDVGEASSGPALERVLGVLVDRLLARSGRRGRTLCAVTLSARLISGGGWHERVVFRQALSDPERIRLALSLRLELLPAPAQSLGLAVERFGPPASEQWALLDDGREARMGRLHEALVQMRAVAGQDAALRAVLVDPDSRVPERRVVFAPIPD